MFESDEELNEFLAELREWRRDYHGPIRKALEDRVAIEVVSKYGKAVIVPADEYASLIEGAYLTRSTANALRLIKDYENATDHTPDAASDSVDPR